MKHRILIAGIGNIFFGDDAFGVEVIRELEQRKWVEQNPSLHVTDFGIRSYDLAYALTDGYDSVILVDALSRGGAPGTVFLIEPDLAALAQTAPELPDAHSLSPASVVQLALSFGSISSKVFLVGCEPASLEPEPLSEVVRSAIPPAIEMIESLVQELERKPSPLLQSV
jgi:hydrogenase maturation protease